MTTIVYCHKTKKIACDSRSTVGGTIDTDNADKFIIDNGEMWFFCGAFADFQKLIDMHNELRPATKLACSAFVVAKDGVFCRCYDEEQNRYMTYKLNCSWTAGSGMDHALTALDMGATAKQAVEIAIKRDVWSGGKVRVFDCIEMEFIE